MTKRSNYKVLVVDDTEAGRYALSRFLRAEGFQTLEAATGAEALALAGGASAVVLDVHLPDIMGVEVCRQLRERPDMAAVPIVHVSAIYVTGHARAAAERAGADAYLVSPVNPRELAQLLDKLIDVRAAREPAV
ncbi:MAG TPA: response regulator [Ramlibacter sp.]|uniref:response regulator n=1 Tax=Ramlibacter sp. TaxID=1917967 RepID=UPI002ED4FF1F